MELLSISISNVIQRRNARDTKEFKELAPLMQSIKQVGLLQPIGVREIGDGLFEIVFGNRRFEACRKLGHKSIPCVIVTNETENEDDFLVMNLTENMQREDITAYQKARLILELVEEHDLSVTEVSVRLGMPPKTVGHYLDIASQIPEGFASKICDNNSDNRRKPGTIPLRQASKFANLRRNFRLKRPQVKELIDWSIKASATMAEVKKVAKFIEAGNSVTAAISMVDDWASFRVVLDARKEDVERIEEEHGQKFTKWVRELVRENLAY